MINVVVGVKFVGFMWCQSLMIQRGVVGGDWQVTMREEERAPMILLLEILHKVISVGYL